MKHLSAIILMIICIFAVPTARGGENQAQIKDSLLRVYVTSHPDISRLQTLERLALLHYATPTYLYYEDKLLEEAVAQKNTLFQSASIYAHLVYYYNRLDFERAAHWMNRLRQFARKHNFYRHYFNAERLMIEADVFNGKTELAIKKAQEMYQQAQSTSNFNGMREACLCLSTAYFSSMRYSESLQALNLALQYIDESTFLTDRADLLIKTVLIYSSLRNNEKLEYYLNQLEQTQTELIRQNGNTNTLYDLCLLTNTSRALYHIRDGRPLQGLEYLKQAKQYINEKSFPPYRNNYLTAYAEYYCQTDNYEKAIEYLDQVLCLTGSVEESQNCQLLKADLLAHLERTDEALPLYIRYTQSKDSLLAAFSYSQIEQIQELYNLNALIRQKEIRHTLFNRICLATVLICIAALTLINLRMYANRKRLRRNEQEMRNLAKIAEEANRVKNLFLENMSYSIRIPLNNVVGFSQLLSNEKGLSEEEQKEYSDIIQQNSSELIQLVNDALDLSRLEANMMKFQLQECNVQEWCNDLSNLVQMQSNGNIHLHLHAEVEDTRLRTDVNRLTQIVSDMLLPPDKSLIEKERAINISATLTSDGNKLKVKIADSPLADPAFASQKSDIHQRIAELFFKHFGGSFHLEKGNGETPDIVFTHRLLSAEETETPPVNCF